MIVPERKILASVKTTPGMNFSIFGLPSLTRSFHLERRRREKEIEEEGKNTANEEALLEGNCLYGQTVKVCFELGSD